MRKASIMVTVATAMLMSGVAVATLARAAEEQKGAAEEQDVIGENEVYGGTLMTMEERRELHMKYCGAKTDAERDQVFWEHGKFMHARAKEKGIEMPKADQKNWIRHTCPSMEVMHGKPDDAGHHGKPHTMQDVAPKTDEPVQAQ